MFSDAPINQPKSLNAMRTSDKLRSEWHRHTSHNIRIIDPFMTNTSFRSISSLHSTSGAYQNTTRTQLLSVGIARFLLSPVRRMICRPHLDTRIPDRSVTRPWTYETSRQL